MISMKFFGTQKPGEGVKPIKVVQNPKIPFGMKNYPVNSWTGKHLQLGPNPPATGASTVTIASDIFGLLRHGFTIKGTTLTLLSGKQKMHGLKVCTTPQATFPLGGVQYFYVHHVRNSTATAWAVAKAEPGTTDTGNIDTFFYKFDGNTLVEIGHMGDINLDVPI
jgi:hypothetical protein